MRKLSWILFIFLLLVLFGQCLFFAWDAGQTVDETFYNGSGYPIVRYNNYGFLGEHPPLMMQLGSLPLLLIQPNFPINDPVRLPGNDPTMMDLSKTGSKFLYEMGNDPHLILFLERLPVIFLTLILGAVLFHWAYSLYGAGGALLSLFLFATCPNIIAHGSIFTTDMGVTAFMFFTLYRMKLFFETPSARNAVYAGVLAGLTMLSKMSAMSLLPITLSLFLLWAFSKKKSEFSASEESKGTGFLTVVLCFFILTTSQKIIFSIFGPLCILAAGTYSLKRWGNYLSVKQRKLALSILYLAEFVISIVIFFINKKSGSFLQAGMFLWSLGFLLLQVLVLKELLYDFWRPLRFYLLLWFAASCVIVLGFTDFYLSAPRWKMFARYIRSFNIAFNHSQNHHAICFANSFITCDWRYFITTMFAKTPVVTQFLFLTGLFSLLSLKISKMNKWLLVLPPILFLLIASFLNRINIGLRHVLPVYPFIFLIAGATFPVFCKAGEGQISALKRYGTKIALGVLVLLLGWQVFRHVTFAPHYLSYFSETVGSVEAGAKITGDSNLNWGQDNVALTKWMKRLGNPPAKISPVSTMNEPELHYYGFYPTVMSEEDWDHPSPGYYVLDIHGYVREQGREGSWFYGKKPHRVIGSTFYFFEVPAASEK